MAIEIAACAQLIKGYGDTHERGMASYQKILSEVVEPALSGSLAVDLAGVALANLRAAALADPSGQRLDEVLAAIADSAVPRAAE